jgi:hypothetical protein
MFENSIPNIPIVFSALKQSHPSTVYVDDLDSPRKALLHMEFRNYVCYAGESDSDFLASALCMIRAKTPAELFWSASEDGWQPPLGFESIENILAYFEHPQSVEFYEMLYQNRSDDRQILPIDEHLFNRCAWRTTMCSIYGDFDRFHKAAFGFVLCDGDQPVSESYAAFLGPGIAEIGIVTHNDF